MIRELFTRPRMINIYKKAFCTFVGMLWAFWAYVIIWWIADQIEFHRAMGGMF